jgi:hypothetical protein
MRVGEKKDKANINLEGIGNLPDRVIFDKLNQMDKSKDFLIAVQKGNNVLIEVDISGSVIKPKIVRDGKLAEREISDYKEMQRMHNSAISYLKKFDEIEKNPEKYSQKEIDSLNSEVTKFLDKGMSFINKYEERHSIVCEREIIDGKEYVPGTCKNGSIEKSVKVHFQGIENIEDGKIKEYCFVHFDANQYRQMENAKPDKNSNIRVDVTLNQPSQNQMIFSR